MCAQCAFIALAAIGTYSAFHNQIRARVDKALGIDDAALKVHAPNDIALGGTAQEPLSTERSVTLAVFILALGQLRHRAEPRPASDPPPATTFDGELFPGASAAGD